MKIIKQNLVIVNRSKGIMLYTLDSYKEQWGIPYENDNDNLTIVMGNNMADFSGGSFRLLNKE